MGWVTQKKKNGRQPSKETMKETRAESGSPINYTQRQKETGGLGVSQILGDGAGHPCWPQGHHSAFRNSGYWGAGLRLFFFMLAPVSARPADCQQGFRDSAFDVPRRRALARQERARASWERCRSCGTFDTVVNSAHPPRLPRLPALSCAISGRSPLIPRRQEDSTSAKPTPFCSLILWQGASQVSGLKGRGGSRQKRRATTQGKPRKQDSNSGR
ncbi:hypothetical protein B0H67DRAFT_232588 [Lasiosphaeris hirsuta]|uniref:Uncharacterized protein n=1 Tax=Lasiosphaeris hirsuta TaxID=260670 RepID=A0AA40DVI4_9PEZI|nr:hypothetical protein B0H67DRAFT_232588 [Lasiosphaeris hirsuta]